MQVTVPSERNFQIFNAIECLGKSRREAAELFSISATRVQQIVAQVRDYLSRFGSPELLYVSPAHAELGCLRLSYEKLRFMYRQVMRLWDDSVDQSLDIVKQDAAIKMGLKKPEPNLKFIQQAMKISVEQTKLAGRMAQAYTELEKHGSIQPPPPVEEVVEADDDAELPISPAATVIMAPPPGTKIDTEPPTGTCTVEDIQTFEAIMAAHNRNRASACPEEDYDATLAAMQARKEKQKGKKHPAQPR